MDSEIDMWTSYSGGDKKSLVPLLNSMKNIREQWTNKFSSAPLPRSSISANVTSNMITAFDTFDPNKGVKLTTHVNNMLKKTNRFIYEHQNIARIPENRIVKITTFNVVKDKLAETLGREANTSEIADELKWSYAEVERMNRDIRKDINLDDNSDFSFQHAPDSRAGDVARYIYEELTPREKLVYEHTTGIGGNKIISNKGIAKKLGVSPGMVSQIKSVISSKIEKAL